MYRNCPQNFNELKEAITIEIRAIDAETRDAVMKNALKRAQSVFDVGGGHLRDIIFRD